MKILLLDKFVNKINQDISESEKIKILSFIQEIKDINNINELDGIILVKTNIYSVSVYSYLLFFTITKNTIIFIDMIIKKTTNINTNINPKYNSNINPKYNSNINPKYNSNINPKLNSNINPKLNSNINPKLNSNINPKLNSNINPKLNSNINPKLNSNINPKLNSNINPKLNPEFNGFYLFDLEGVKTHYILIANINIILIFNFENEVVYFGVKRATGYAIYDFKTHEYLNYLESDGKDGFNQFDYKGNWIGYVK